MSLPVTIPFTFGNATTTQSLSSLDTNFTTIKNAVNGLTNGASQINVASISATGTANATTYLRGDGAWATISGGGSGTVTSINANSTIGFTFTGGPVTSSGTLTLSGPTPGTSGNVLTSNGTAWVSQAVSVPQGAKAWARWNGSTGTITSSYNVSSITRNSAGQYVVNFTSNLADANYAPIMSCAGDVVYNGYGLFPGMTSAPTTSGFAMWVKSNSGTAADAPSVQIVVFGN